MAKMIGDYEIISELGRGGMGVVYMAREESLQRNVAIKMLGNQLLNDEAVAERFMREARVVADLNHPNLVQVFRVDRHEDQPYFVMEFVEGDSLKALIQRERQMQPTRALKILEEVASGLAAAHDKGVIHRDIKPENIMLTKYGGVKVVDFGIARDENADTRLTTTGMGLGTPNYLSPEVCLSQEVDQRSDIFSLGVVLFEMLTGDTPFKSDSPFEMMTKVVEAKIPDIKALNPNVDEGVKKILAKMIAKRPKKRYQHCNELISDIEDYRAGREPRWAKDVILDEAVETGAAASTSGSTSAIDDAPTVAATTPVAGSAGAATEAVAAATGRTETLHAEGSSKRGLAVAAAFVLLLVGGAGASTWYLLAGSERPLVSWFDDPPADEVAATALEVGSHDDAVVRSVAAAPATVPGESADQDPARDRAGFEAASSNRPDLGSAESPSGPTAASKVPAGAAGTGEPSMVSVDESFEPSVDGRTDASGSMEPEATAAGFQFDVQSVPAPAVDVSPAAMAAADLQGGDGSGGSDGLSEATSSKTGIAAASSASTAASASMSSAQEEAFAEASEQPPADLVSPALDTEQAIARVESRPPAPAWNPAAPRVLVVSSGDPAVAEPIEQTLERALNRAAFELMDEDLMDGMAYAETLPDIIRAARDAGADILVFADVVPTGERQLQFYGRTDYQYLANLQVRVVSLHERRNVGAILRQNLEYVGLNADEKAREASNPVARDIVSRLRALRAGAGAASG
jgi:predicted Ser/Thr protein kinase